MKCAYTIAITYAVLQATFAHAAPQGQGEFTSYVAGLLQKEVGTENVTVKAPLTLSLGELQANLDRIFSFCQRNIDGCETEVAQYVKAAAQVHKERSSPPNKELVRVVVRSRQYIESAQSGIPAEMSPQIQPRPFIGDLLALPVIDSPRTIKMLSIADNDKLKLSAQEAYELGLANLGRELKPIADVAKPAGKGQIGQLTGDSYHPSRLLLIESWAALAKAQGGVLIVAAPTTDAVLYIGEDSVAAIDALRTFVSHIQQRAPNRLSDVLLRWKASGWEVVR
jgi:uncharacterized protein YtpQ (UPF0354 family)